MMYRATREVTSRRRANLPTTGGENSAVPLSEENKEVSLLCSIRSDIPHSHWLRPRDLCIDTISQGKSGLSQYTALFNTGPQAHLSYTLVTKQQDLEAIATVTWKAIREHCWESFTVRQDFCSLPSDTAFI